MNKNIFEELVIDFNAPICMEAEEEFNKLANLTEKDIENDRNT
jgi:hypothetical protein